MRPRPLIQLALLCALVTATLAQAQQTTHGFALFGELKYPAAFTHFDYARPDAPKGGTFTYAWGNSFDTLNPFLMIGTPPAFLTLESAVFERLMVRSGDEPTSLYGLVAESITVPDDYAWAEFRLRAGARWHDGKPITPEDVVFSLETLKTKGSPQLRNDYASVARAEALAPDRVRFTFEHGSRALAYAVAGLAVLPKHWWATREFTRPMSEPPLGSGPYRITNVDAGRAYTLERVPDYWARDLPVNRGRWNFDRIQHDYYRDIAVSFEAFKAGKADLRWETLPAQWATGYEVPAVADGRLVKEMLDFDGATFYAGFYFNHRLPLFQDVRVREAIGLAFDFDWLNRTVLHGEFVRLRSHFDHTELANQGIPQGPELALLEPLRAQLDPRLFTQPWNPPATGADEAGLRRNLRRAAQLLQQAGWTARDGRLVDAAGKPLAFEMLLWDPFFQRIAGPFQANLKRLGIAAELRMVDTTDWFRRLQSFDFELTQSFTLPLSLSPGPELRNLFGSQAAGQRGSGNPMGISDPAVDALIDRVVGAGDRSAQLAAVHALDRVLCWGFHSIPHGYVRGVPIAYWNRFGRPARQATWLRMFWLADTWWIDPAREAALERAGGKMAN